MADRYKKHATTLEGPASGAFAITPHNTNEVSQVTRGIYVGTTGNMRVQMAGFYNDAANTYTGNSVVTFSTIPAGTTLAIRVRKVYTSTTANNMIGLY